MTCLITGGTGFTGSYVVRNLLEAGEKEVICYQRSGMSELLKELVPEKNLKAVKIVQGNLADTLDLFDVIRKHKVDSIIHLAYLLYPYSEIPAVAIRVNVDACNNIFEAARLFGLRRVVWTSSAGVFGRLGDFYGEKVVTEKDVMYRPTRLYGATKALVQFLGKLHYEKYGTDIICLRLSRTYGIGKLSGSGSEFTDLLERAALDMPATVRNADDQWAYCYIEDVARAVVKAWQVSSTKTKIFDVGDGAVYKGRQLAEVIKKVNPKVDIKVEPGMGVYAFPVPDMATSREELGFVPEFPLERGLKEVFNHLRRQKGFPLLP